jgi:hypothetical protein
MHHITDNDLLLYINNHCTTAQELELEQTICRNTELLDTYIAYSTIQRQIENNILKCPAGLSERLHAILCLHEATSH